MIRKGAAYLVNNISNEERLLCLNHNLDQGNHLIRDDSSKGKIEEFIQNKLDHSLLLPIPKSKIIKIPGVESYLIHIVK